MTRRLSARRYAVPALAASLLSLTLAGCDTGWFGDSDKPKLEGTRIAVLQNGSKVVADASLARLPVSLPPAQTNLSWPQAGGFPDHALGHLALSASPHLAWSSSAGSGSGSRLRLLSRPIVAQGRVFVFDAASQLNAVDEASGRSLWQVDLVPPDTRGSSFGGGVAFGDDLLYVATGYAEVIAVNPADGAIVWRKRISSPARGAPTVSKGRVFAQTLDNQTYALSSKDGETLWTHTGILETAGLLGAVSPAVDGSLAVVPYSSGEVFGLRVENGRPAWQDNLTSLRRSGALSSLADIRGLPVIDRGLVLTVSHSGRTAAIDARTGARAWDQEVGGVDTPWPAGEFIFELSNDSELVALTRQNGRIRWVAVLPRYEDPKDKSTALVWTGPVLAGGQLWLAASSGQLVGVSPSDGSVVTQLKLPEPAYIAPVVANGTLFVLTDGGTLSAFR